MNRVQIRNRKPSAQNLLAPRASCFSQDVLLTETSAFLAKRLAASALSQIFALDVVAGIAIGIVMMNRLLD